MFLGSHNLVVLFVCVCFGESFLCSISLLLSDSLSCVLNSVLINAIVHVTYCIWLVDLTANAVYIKLIRCVYEHDCIDFSRFLPEKFFLTMACKRFKKIAPIDN